MSHRNVRSLTVGSLTRVEGEGAMHVRVEAGRVYSAVPPVPRFYLINAGS